MRSGHVLAAIPASVAATWTVDDGAVVVMPLRRLSKTDRDDVATQGQELAAFLSDGDSERVRIVAFTD